MNCDSIWIFAGMTDKMMFGIMMSQLGFNGKDLWENYSELNFRDVMITDYSSDGSKIKVIKSDY
jgi:hypothetical protein